MAQFEILDDAGQVANVVVASAEFVDQRYPGRYREIVDLPAQGQQVTPADVDAEQDRRIDAGFLFNGIQFQSRAGGVTGRTLPARPCWPSWRLRPVPSREICAGRS